jgi:hypothetical protein
VAFDRVTDLLEHNRETALAANSGTPFLLVVADRSEISDMMTGWRDAALTVRALRGTKMRSTNSVFDEFAAALQFPYYCGENWAAFSECLSDMNWLPIETGFVLCIFDAVDVLSDEPGDLGLLCDSLKAAAATYAKTSELGESCDRPALPFRIVLQASKDEEEPATARWQDAGALEVPPAESTSDPEPPPLASALEAVLAGDVSGMALVDAATPEDLTCAAAFTSLRLTPDAVDRVLSAYSVGQITSEEAQRWASFVWHGYMTQLDGQPACSIDIDWEPAYESAIAELIGQLEQPEDSVETDGTLTESHVGESELLWSRTLGWGNTA